METIIGLEALLRWNHPEKGILEASNFITTLEKNPLIIPITEWIISATCLQAKIWQDKNILAGPIAINVSSVQFIQHSLSKVIGEILAETQLSSSCIELEITETVLVEYSDKLYAELDSLKKMGIELVIDDFGTGYSSFILLKTLASK